MQKIKDLNINWQDRNTSNKHSMAASSSCPAWSSQWGHPLGSPVPSHLLLHPHCHRPPRRRLLCCGGDQPHPGQQAHRLWSHCCDRDQSAVLSNNQAQLVFNKMKKWKNEKLKEWKNTDMQKLKNAKLQRWKNKKN